MYNTEHYNVNKQHPTSKLSKYTVLVTKIYCWSLYHSACWKDTVWRQFRGSICPAIKGSSNQF